jgi:parvulin-like peptidyl-prolyl isomerase
MNSTAKMLSVLLGLGLLVSQAWAQATPATPAGPAPGPATQPGVVRPVPGTPPGPGGANPRLTTRPAPGMMPPGMTAPPATRPAPDEWAFTLNGKKYDEGYVERVCRMTAPPGRSEDDILRMLTMQHSQAIEQAVNIAVLEGEAEQLKVTVSEPDVDAQVKKWIDMRLKNGTMTREQFAETVQKNTGKSLDDMLKSMRPGMHIQALVEGLAKAKYNDVTVSEEEIKQAYEQNPVYGAQVRASHILLSSANPRQGMTPEEKEAAKKKADEVLVKVKQPGADFSALAKEYSVDKGANEKGGDLGFFGVKGPMDPTFTAAAFALKPGEISNVVETRFGFHIIKMTETRPARTLEEVREEIVDSLKERSRQMKLQTWFRDTRGKAEVAYAPGKAPASRPARPPMTQPGGRPPMGQMRPGPTPPLGPRPTTAPAGGVVSPKPVTPAPTPK